MDQPSSHGQSDAEQPQPYTPHPDHELAAHASNLEPTQPVASQPQELAENHSSSGGLFVLQWLTYAMWGWCVVALSSLVTAILMRFIGGESTGEFVAYALAAVVILFPLAFISDVYYARLEPVKKQGGALVIMVLHAVLFALIGVGSLITSVFAFVALFTSASSSDETGITILSALLVGCLYGATFLRTLNPARMRRFLPRTFRFGMLGVIVIAAILSIFGPLAHVRTLRDDKLLVENASKVQTAVNNYARDNNRLPERLSDLEVRDEAKEIVDRGLIDYEPNTQPRINSYNRYPSQSLSRQVYYYRFCMTFKEASSDPYRSSYDYSSTYLSVYSHSAGRECYDLKTN